MAAKEQMQHLAAQNSFLPYDKIFFISTWINIHARSGQESNKYDLTVNI